MTNLLTLSTMREIAPTIYEMLTRPLDLLTPKQVDALLQVRQLYVQAREAQWQGLREQYGDERMVELMNGLLAALRQKGPQHLMVEAAAQLSPSQRATAYAVAAEIMRSDGPLQPDELNILTNLATTLELAPELTSEVQSVMDLLHADVLVAG